MRPHQHHCPYCNKMYSCRGLDCIEEAGEEITCPHCEWDTRDADENDHLSNL